ncbi:hypothetical protein RZS08_01780, partial [Arthrospira platensis SPKY1]|nr:hypothetical protein [Arthrospira platensis SPKY1]
LERQCHVGNAAPNLPQREADQNGHLTGEAAQLGETGVVEGESLLGHAMGEKIPGQRELREEHQIGSRLPGPVDHGQMLLEVVGELARTGG